MTRPRSSWSGRRERPSPCACIHERQCTWAPGCPHLPTRPSTMPDDLAGRETGRNEPTDALEAADAMADIILNGIDHVLLKRHALAYLKARGQD